MERKYAILFETAFQRVSQTALRFSVSKNWPVGAPNRMARKDQEKLQLLTVVQLYSRRAKAWAPRSQDLGAWALTSSPVFTRPKGFMEIFAGKDCT
mmetsp:Transcript_28656/g.59192  ORF Transcript_28656/g.59192 Transcript_28656/m.59192 type:complete len:96 (-) Transcript_28656:104-391(-)